MPRIARTVVPGIAHHVIQRGNRQQRIFHSDADRRCYCQLLGDALEQASTTCLAWCLMENHVHLVLVPNGPDGLRAALSRVHTAYAQRINKREQVSGHLFQGRFLSYPMDDAHMMVAVRYVENNPVAAGLVAKAIDWPWSSARAHALFEDDGLTNVSQLGRHVDNWQAMLERGLEAGSDDATVEQALRTGLKLGTAGRPRGRPFNKRDSSL
jgi:putative transposase